MPQKPLPQSVRKKARELYQQGFTTTQVARKLNVSLGTVSNCCKDIIDAKEKVKDEAIKAEILKGTPITSILNKLKTGKMRVRKVLKVMSDKTPKGVFDNVDPVFGDDDDGLPPSDEKDIPPFKIDRPGRYLILSDVHIPCHSLTAIRCAVAEGVRQGVTGVLLNGDILDMHQLSRHDQDPRAQRYVDELKLGQQFLSYLREKFPKADMYYKLGNHEARLEPYIFQRAPALEGLDCLSLEHALEMRKYGFTKIDDKRVIHLGKLHVIHGHEFRGGGGGVNPARWLYLKARAVALCGHFHRTSEHHANNIADKPEAAWSLGCLCGRKPFWLPLNEWNHGFCIVEIDRDGGFIVQNKRVLHGKAV